NQELIANDMPAVRKINWVDMNALGRDGTSAFVPLDDWAIYFDASFVQKEPDAESASEFFATVLHETRHLEQRFLQARLQARSPRGNADTLGLPGWVVHQAANVEKSSPMTPNMLHFSEAMKHAYTDRNTVRAQENGSLTSNKLESECQRG